MKAGPAHAVIGTASCPLCHDRSLQIKTNKRGYPAAYCFECETQFQPRDEKGSRLLLGKVHTWSDQHAAIEGMLGAEDVPNLQPSLTPLPPMLPPHLSKSTGKARSKPPATEPPPPPAKPKSIWDEPLWK